jgi:hypothetical protein
MRDLPDVGGRSAPAHADEDGIDAVKGGAGHQADDVSGSRHR